MELSVVGILGLGVVVLISYSILESLFDTTLSSVPVIQFSWTDLLVRRSMSIRSAMLNAYDKLSKNGKLFRIAKDIYVLPPAVLPESRRIPTAVLSSSAANEDFLFLSPSLGHDYWEVINFVRQQVTRHIPQMIPSILDEIHVTFKKNFPPETIPRTTDENGQGWYATPIFSAVLKTTGQVAVMVFFGRKYSRDAAFVEKTASYARSVTIQGVLIQTFVPISLRPLLKKIVLPFTPNANKAKEIRLALSEEVYNYMDAGEDELQAQIEKQDCNYTLLPMLVKYVQNNPEYKNATREQILDGVIGRAIGTLFAAVDTTAMTFSQIMYDLTGHPKAQYVDPIIEEVQRVFARHDNSWTVQSLGELVLLDSFIKESQRMHPIALALGNRKVMPEAGYTLGSNFPGMSPIHLKKGQTVTMPLGPVHFDENIYPDPLAFKGFRFVKDAVPSSQPSDIFMAFGHGRHACPGRHVALSTLKLMAIEFLTRYEWQEVERPKDTEVGIGLLPNMSQKVNIRRKVESN